MDFNVVILFIGWCIYGLVHSVLATTAVKQFAHNLGIKLGAYKVIYNVIAVVGLYALIKFQTTVSSVRLFSSTILITTLGMFLIIVGFAIMLICIFKYFKQMNGFSQEVNQPTLIISGLHRFVRHPLYTGTFIFIAGLFFLFPFMANLVSISVIIAYTLIAIRFEEKKLILTFGEDYISYQKRVPKILPDFWKR